MKSIVKYKAGDLVRKQEIVISLSVNVLSKGWAQNHKLLIFSVTSGYGNEVTVAQMQNSTWNTLQQFCCANSQKMNLWHQSAYSITSHERDSTLNMFM